MIPISEMKKPRLGEAQELAGEMGVTELVCAGAGLHQGPGFALPFRQTQLGKEKRNRGGLDGNAVRNEVTPERRGKVETRTRRSQGRLCPTARGLCLGIGKPKWAEDRVWVWRENKSSCRGSSISWRTRGRLPRQEAEPMRSHTRNPLIPQIWCPLSWDPRRSWQPTGQTGASYSQHHPHPFLS